MSAERPYIDKEHPQIYKALAEVAVASRPRRTKPASATTPSS